MYSALMPGSFPNKPLLSIFLRSIPLWQPDISMKNIKLHYLKVVSSACYFGIMNAFTGKAMNVICRKTNSLRADL
jgi:hypothetical protein